MAGTMHVPRRRGVLIGALLILLGAWGAVIPFVGPYFGYAYTPDTAWVYTEGRLLLEILPGAAVFAGGVVLLASALRPAALAGASLSALGGAWFAVGTVAMPLWNPGSGLAGAPTGDALARAVQEIGFFTGLGVVIVFLAALAIGRLSLVGAGDKERLVTNRPTPAAMAQGQPTAGTGPRADTGAPEEADAGPRVPLQRPPSASGG